MKLNKQTLKRIIKEELKAIQQEGMMDDVLDSQLNPLRGMTNQRPAEPMVTKGKLSRSFKDPKPVFDSLREEYPFIEVTEQYAFVPDRIYDYGAGGMEGDGPSVDIEMAIEGMPLKEVDVLTPEAGTRYYFMHRGK